MHPGVQRYQFAVDQDVIKGLTELSPRRTEAPGGLARAECGEQVEESALLEIVDSGTVGALVEVAEHNGGDPQLAGVRERLDLAQMVGARLEVGVHRIGIA